MIDKIVVSSFIQAFKFVYFQSIFAENKEKLILAALNSIMKTDFEPSEMSPDDLEAFFQAIHRLVASKVGFSAFTNLSG